MARKAKARKAKARKSSAKAMKVTPTYLSVGASYTMGLHDVVRALKVIEKHNRLRKFVSDAKSKKSATVSVSAAAVNFVKDFMVKYEMQNDPVGRHIVNAQGGRRRDAGPRLMATRASIAGGDRFRCRF